MGKQDLFLVSLAGEEPMNLLREEQGTRRRQAFVGASLLLGCVILAAASYFHGVPQNPHGFYIDESSIAYNAYTISRTGRDEYGEAWPLYFTAFGEFKNPVHIYQQRAHRRRNATRHRAGCNTKRPLIPELPEQSSVQECCPCFQRSQSFRHHSL